MPLRRICVILLLAVAVVLNSCGQPGETPEREGTNSSPTPREAPSAEARASPAAADTLEQVAAELRELITHPGAFSGSSRAVALRVDSTVARAMRLRNATHHAALLDSARGPLSAYFRSLIARGLARVPDLEQFIARASRADGNYSTFEAAGPALSFERRAALADVEEASAFAWLWASPEDTARLAKLRTSVGQYANWKYITDNITQTSRSEQERLSREWTGVHQAALFSPEFLANGRLEFGGRWWIQPGSSQRGQDGRVLNTLCVQKDLAGDIHCDAFSVERELEIDGGKWLFYWGSQLYRQK